MIDFINRPFKGAELLPVERFKLFHWVLEKKPYNILEIGTGKGGATYYMAEAIKEIGKGHIITCDPHRKPDLKLFKEFPFIEYYKMKSDVVIQDVIDRGIEIDFIFFDGPEDPKVALRNIKQLEKWITTGTLFSMHDWETEERIHDNGISTKAKLIRPYIEKSKRWREIEVLDGLESSDTVGLCFYQYKR